MNTLLGFACSLGLKLGYNDHHHEKTTIANTASHSHHDHNQEHKHAHQSSGSKDDCCSNNVTAFNLLDKSTTNTISVVHPPFATAFLVSFYPSWALPKMFIPKNIRAFTQNHHPPIPDIRVAIQSFQI